MTVRNATQLFWDASAVVPLCVPEPRTALARRLLREYGPMVVWWGTPVEVLSAFSCLTRKGTQQREDRERAAACLAALRRTWIEVVPSERVRSLAEDLLMRHTLRAGDAFQLGAALSWCQEHPRNRPLVCFDRRLAEAAAAAGFRVFSDF